MFQQETPATTLPSFQETYSPRAYRSRTDVCGVFSFKFEDIPTGEEIPMEEDIGKFRQPNLKKKIIRR